MPYTWVPSELYHEYKGVKIYYVYKNDFDNCPRSYRYATSEDGSDDGDENGEFDIRELSTWNGDFVQSIESAIDKGELIAFDE